MEDLDRTYIEQARKNFTKGYRLGKLIPHHDFDLLQKQFALKALDTKSKNHQAFRAISLGFDTALLERGLLQQKPTKPVFKDRIKEALKTFRAIEQKSKDQSDDLSLER